MTTAQNSVLTSKLFGGGKAEPEAGPRLHQGREVIDPAVLRRWTDTQPNFRENMVPMFQDDLRACKESIRNGIDARDKAQTTQGSNGLRSLGATIGSKPLRDDAQMITEAVERGNWDKVIAYRETLFELVDLCDAALGAVRKG